MTLVTRWGRSAYETDRALALERAGAEDLGLDWQHHPDRSPPPDLERTEALVVTSTVRVDARALARFTGSLILTTTSGYDHVDVDAAAGEGVPVARLPQARRDAVVDHALASILHFARRIPAQQAAAARNHWARGDLPAMAQLGLRGAPILVVGLGVIGTRMAEVLTALGARVMGTDPLGVPPFVEEVPLDEGLAACRIVTLHCSLTDSSRGLFDRARLERLPEGCILVNTARGPILDAEAAAGLAIAGHLGGLSVDSYPVEPWPHLVDHPRVLMTPHAAGYTDDLGERVARGVIEALTAWTTGDEVPYRVA